MIQNLVNKQVMMSVIDLETSSSTQLHITNTTTKICVTSSAIRLALFASSTRSCQFCVDMPVDVRNTNACNSLTTWRCALSAGKIANKFLRDWQIAVNHREMFCRFSCPWGFKPKAGMCLQEQFQKCSWPDTSKTFWMDGQLDTWICIAVFSLRHISIVDSA